MDLDLDSTEENLRNMSSLELFRLAHMLIKEIRHLQHHKNCAQKYFTDHELAGAHFYSDYMKVEEKKLEEE